MNTQHTFRQQISTVLSSQELQQLKKLESSEGEDTRYHLKAMYADICTRLMLCKKENAHRYVERAGLIRG